MTTANVVTLSAEHHAAIIASLVAGITYKKPATVKAVTATVESNNDASVTAENEARDTDELSDGSQAAPVIRQLITSVPLPMARTITAKDYIVGMRRATDRDSKVRLIAAFAGYDTRGDYATQEYSATAQAHRDLRGAPKALAAPVHTARATVAGYVHGMPNMTDRRETDLAARFSLGYALCPTVTDSE